MRIIRELLLAGSLFSCSSADARKVDRGRQLLHPARRMQAVLLAGIAVAYVAATWVTRPDLGFWSPDSSIRYVQLVSLLQQKYRELAVVYPGAALDPEGHFYPVSGGFATVRGSKVYLSYSPYFPALAGPLYWMLGRPGLVALPILSGLVAVWATQLWLRRECRGAVSVGSVLVGLGTPLIVYSTVFWDHAPVTALSTASLVLLTNGRLLEGRGAFWAGVLAGAPTWFRNEGYVFALAVLTGCGLVARRRGLPALALGVLCGAAVGWILNWQLYGHPLGLKGLAGARAVQARLGGAEGWLAQRVVAAYDLLVSVERFVDALEPVRVGESLAVAAAVLVASALLRLGVVNRSPASVVAAGVGVVGVTGWLLGSDSEVMGLVPAVPAIALLGLWKPLGPWERLVGWTGIAYVVSAVILGSEGGLQWGPRYLLPVVPALVWLGALGLSRAYEAATGNLRVAIAIAGTCIALAGFAVQVKGLLAVGSQVEMAVRVERLLRSTGSPILVTGQPLFHMMGFLYFDRVLMRVDNALELEELVRSFAKRRVARWTYIPLYGPAFDARVVERLTAGGPWKFRIVDDRMPLAWVMGQGRYIFLRMITYTGSP